MASGSGKKGPWGNPGMESSEARDRLAFGVGPPVDAEAFQEAQSRLRLPNDPASLQRWFRDDRKAALECLQRWFHEDPKAALKWVTKARVPALVPALVDLLQDEAITHFHMAEALEQIGDEHDRTRAIKIKRSEEAQVESFPQRAITSAAEDHEIREHLERGELREAFRINGARAAELIIEDPILHFSHANRLTPLLREQAGVQLLMALALASIAGEPQQKSRALATLFAEAAQTTDRETLCFALRSLKSFEALTVIPGLIAYLQEADDGPPRDVALETFEHLIVHGLAADASDAARRARDLTLRCFVALLGGAALDEQERVRVVGIVLRCADVLGGGLDAVIGRMAELSNVTVEEMGLRVCGRVLARPGEIDATERTDAAGWIQRHLSGEHAAIPTSAFASQSPAAQTSEGSIESPRAPIHRSLTDVRSPRQTSPVSRMDASQWRSTAAPSPELDQVDLGSQSFGPETARTIHTTPMLEPLADPITRVRVIWRELRDIAADCPDTIPAILEGSRSFSAEFDADASASVSMPGPVIDRPIRPAAGSFLDHREMKRWADDIQRWRVSVPLGQAMAEVRDFLDFYKGKHFPTPEENVMLADTAMALVARVGCEFRYNSERARVGCIPATGRFEVRPRTRGKSFITTNDFPSLEIAPQED